MDETKKSSKQIMNEMIAATYVRAAEAKAARKACLLGNRYCTAGNIDSDGYCNGISGELRRSHGRKTFFRSLL